MAIKECWFVDELSIFVFSKGIYNYLEDYVEIDYIRITDNFAEINLISSLPNGFKLLDVSEHSIIAIQFTEYGKRDEYNEDFRHIFIENIEVFRKWIDTRDGYILAHLTASGLVKW